MAETRKRPWLRGLAIVAITAAVVAPSAVLAASSFSDVPATNIFSDDIEWMADSGITSGCGGDQFCPGLSVTREQMAAFLHRLAVNQVVDAGTVSGKTSTDFLAVSAKAADSSKLGGATSDQLVPIASAENDGVPGAILETAKGLIEVNSVTLTAPEDGVFIISGTTYVDPESISTNFILQTKIDGTVVGSPGWSAWFHPASDTQSFELSYTIAESVTAGAHTVTQLVGPKVGTTNFYHNHETLTVLFVPAGQAVFTGSSAPAGATIVESETGGD